MADAVGIVTLRLVQLRLGVAEGVRLGLTCYDPLKKVKADELGNGFAWC